MYLVEMIKIIESVRTIANGDVFISLEMNDGNLNTNVKSDH